MLRYTWALAFIVFTPFLRSSPSAEPAHIASPLHITMVMLHGRPSLPVFELRLTNTGNRDLVLNLGMLLRTKQYLDAVHFSMSDASGKTVQLAHMRRPAGVAGRVDPLIVSLPIGCSFSFPVNLELYLCSTQGSCPLRPSPGRYFITADLDATNAQGLEPFEVWRGHVHSLPTAFVIGTRK